MIKGLIIQKAKDTTKAKINRSSQFHVVINTNISYKRIQEQPNQKEYLSRLVHKVNEGLKSMKTNITHFYKDGGDNPKLKQFSFNLEVGPVRKFIHLDGYIYFDGFTHLDSKKIQQHFNEVLERYCKGCFVHISFVPDNITAVEQYSRKDGMTLI